MSGATRHRVTIGFASDGRRAARLAADSADAGRVASWTLTPHGPHRGFSATVTGAATGAQALPLPGDRLLYAKLTPTGRQLQLLARRGVLAAAPAPALRTLVADPTGAAIGVGPTAGGGTALYRIADDLTGASADDGPVARFPATLHGPALVVGARLLFHARIGGRTTPVWFDPQTATLTPWLLPGPAGHTVPVCATGDQVVLALSTEARSRLVVAAPGRPGLLQPIEDLAVPAGRVRPLALRPDGAELALRVRIGVRYRLLLHHRHAGETREVDLPPGTPDQVAAWTDHGLWLGFSPTTAPAGLWWLPPGGRTLLPPPGTPVARPAQVESLPGPAGPIETITYGDWRAADRVVLALHGGPAEHWQLRFEPKLRAVAARAAVVAPNQRGSTGYGRDHELAIRGAWGGPDLADILALGAHLSAVRGDCAARPSLYGVSYGAFLALLAMAAEPEYWSGVVAVAPFLSGAALRADANPPVRALIDRLDGVAPVVDEYGARDLLRVAAGMRGRVLLLHGARDQTVPVGHSRRLAAALSAAPGVDLTYREVAEAGHDPVPTDPASPTLAELVRFLSPDPLDPPDPPHPAAPATTDRLPGRAAVTDDDAGRLAGWRTTPEGGEQYGSRAGVRAGGAGAAASRGGADRG
ncbi:prolyl oligopeptidase family serine peptidase [Natronosporangium hydrolyticum]|uniref:Prolyl oligopeptidase family serine peptidase n=1 Tax=Natronosporangium hydrolyticum TaxID=2811111 RepID=A0A895YMC8_9ACTN|nr:prolyl oligopeptidase family serine peptidase [Natronosporangium hydrolyticum]QSB16629.1 prolyl oligopeptidase family serine peptidase [Natronosporangium hydrolyticum]